MEISQFVEQSMSVIAMVHNDVSQSSERMYELQLHEHAEMHHLHHIDTTFNGEIILQVIQSKIGVVVIFNLVTHGDEKMMILMKMDGNLQTHIQWIIGHKDSDHVMNDIMCQVNESGMH